MPSAITTDVGFEDVVSLEQARTHLRIGSKDFDEEIKTALKSDDLELAERLAHTLKGLAGTLAASELTEASTELEAALKRGESGKLGPLLDRVEEHLAVVLRSARGLQSEPDAGDAERESHEEATDPGLTAPLLSELGDLLRENNLAAEDCLTRVKRQLRGSGVGPALKRLDEQVGRFDFNSALETLGEIAGSLKIPLE